MDGRSFLQSPIGNARHADPDTAAAARKAAGAAATPTGAARRLLPIDAFRGVIMVVMSWDHARDMLADHAVGQRGRENWRGVLSDSDDNWLVFLQRWLSHYCAPGFFFTMGIGMLFLTRSRRRRGWGWGRLVKYFCLRALVLIVVGRLVDLAIAPELIPILAQNATLFPAPSHNASGSPSSGGTSIFRGPQWLIPLIGIWEVMTALGFTMGLVGVLMPALSVSLQGGPDFGVRGRLGEALAYAGAALAFAASTAAILSAQDGDPCGPVCEGPNATLAFPRFGAVADGPWEVFLRFFLLPGEFDFGAILYPVIPWAGVTLAGVGFGYEFVRDPRTAYRRARWCACAALALFVAFRFAAVPWLGNIRGWPRGHDEGSTNAVIRFLTVCKYPPSLEYALMTLGVDGGVLCLLEWAMRGRPASAPPARVVDVLLVFGQVPLFFYTVHFWALGLLGFCVKWWAVEGLAIWWVPAPWVGVLVALYFPCRWYRGFKRGKPTGSCWRML